MGETDRVTPLSILLKREDSYVFLAPKKLFRSPKNSWLKFWGNDPQKPGSCSIRNEGIRGLYPPKILGDMSITPRHPYRGGTCQKPISATKVDRDSAAFCAAGYPFNDEMSLVTCRLSGYSSEFCLFSVMHVVRYGFGDGESL